MLPRPMEVFTRGTQAGKTGASTQAGAVRATRLEAALGWAAALAPSPLRLATSCCGMAMTQGGDFFEQLGSAPPAASGRAADLLIVAGSITRRQLPSILELYARMAPPRWVMAWGDCAISGGAYTNYATISGLSRVLTVDVVVHGCPPAPQALRAALESLRTGASSGQRRASSGAPGQPIGDSRPAGGVRVEGSGHSFRAFEWPLRRSEGG